MCVQTPIELRKSRAGIAVIPSAAAAALCWLSSRSTATAAGAPAIVLARLIQWPVFMLLPPPIRTTPAGRCFQAARSAGEQPATTKGEVDSKIRQNSPHRHGDKEDRQGRTADARRGTRIVGIG